MKVKGRKRLSIYLTVLIFILLTSTVYGIVLVKHDSDNPRLVVSNTKKVVNDINTKDLFNEDLEVQYIVDKTGLSKDVSKYLLDMCRKKELDIFVVLGLMKVESNFNPKVVGAKGERGLGQLMENTARPLAKNLGIEYSPEKLFDPKYNILLFTTQLKYLKTIMNNDIHKILTAYNRGEYGLKKYMASRSGRRNPAMSTYSIKVLEYANKYRKEFNEDYKSK